MASSYRRAVLHGWVPDQHGAWPIALVPPVIGMVLGGPAWAHALLITAWLAAFFLYNAATMWWRSARRRRYRAALLTWATVAAIAGATLFILRPGMFAWIPVFLPFLGVALYEVQRGRPRSTLSRLATVLASCLLTPVAFDLGAHTARMGQWWPWMDRTDISVHTGWGHVWCVTLALALYFVGTIPSTRVLFRKRDDEHWYRLSVAYHLLAFLVVAVLVAFEALAWPVLAAFALVVARAVAFPLIQRARGGLPVMLIGLSETFLCLVVAVSLVL